jgi:hypothetical protein
MSYLQDLIAGYGAGLAEPNEGSLKALEAELRSASGAWERGRLLGSIAILRGRKRSVAGRART